MGFDSYTSMANSWDAGRVWRQHIHKTATPVVTGVGYWADLSMAAGTPKYNAYVGNQYEFTAMTGSSNFGINTGGTGTKYLSRMSLGGSGAANSAFPANVILCDYAGFYPLVDLDSTDYQEFINHSDDPLVDEVPRHTSGLKLMVVCTTPQGTPSPIQGQIVYQNSSGNTNVANFYVQAANVGQINNFATITAGVTGSSPFVNLGPGCFDVQKVLGVTMFNSCGGFAAFVLVKPLVEVTVPDIITPYEIDFPIHKPPAPEILSGAYLNMIYQPTSVGTATGIIRGAFAFVRSS